MAVAPSTCSVCHHVASLPRLSDGLCPFCSVIIDIQFAVAALPTDHPSLPQMALILRTALARIQALAGRVPPSSSQPEYLPFPPALMHMQYQNSEYNAHRELDEAAFKAQRATKQQEVQDVLSNQARHTPSSWLQVVPVQSWVSSLSSSNLLFPSAKKFHFPSHRTLQVSVPLSSTLSKYFSEKQASSRRVSRSPRRKAHTAQNIMPVVIPTPPSVPKAQKKGRTKPKVRSLNHSPRAALTPQASQTL